MRLLTIAGWPAALVSIGFSLPASSADLSAKCSEESSTLGIFLCMDKVQAELDSSLDKSYLRFFTILEKIEKDSLADMPKGLLVDGLKNAQNAWIAYREASCDLEASFAYGGSAAKTDRIACVVRLTEKRLNELEYQSLYWENH